MCKKQHTTRLEHCNLESYYYHFNPIPENAKQYAFKLQLFAEQQRQQVYRVLRIRSIYIYKYVFIQTSHNHFQCGLSCTISEHTQHFDIRCCAIVICHSVGSSVECWMVIIIYAFCLGSGQWQHIQQQHNYTMETFSHSFHFGCVDIHSLILFFFYF